MRVAVVNYGVGNIFSVTSALKRLGVEVEVVAKLDPKSYDAIVLPGVGNFEAGSKALSERGLRGAIIEAINAGVPVLGICLGMQLMLESSEEGEGEGLGVVKGRVVRLRVPGKLPHMGWNSLSLVRWSEFLDGLGDQEWAYFVHSYYPSPDDREVVLCETEYFIRFPSVLGFKGLYGTQFHPEKSGETGRKLLRNFIYKCVRR
ncbi:MAG: imidazole glycerol phosphate synthase subunit HisH [Aigarchaeota archaeon]|nr:imidazole glycerol phosphate synthase subunit HisH [Aigarchaeota archaeon]MDW8092186.1 imidazole glycerol phosphate synthase subunit HisH [Nitrososphaerota archaeon]